MNAKKELLAVALRYPHQVEAPIITAKESGRLAARMVELAKENDVPIVQDDVLANVLSVQQIGSAIPEETWLLVARIFAFIKKVEDTNAFNKTQV